MAITGVLIVLLAISGLLWFLSYGAGNSPPSSLEIDGLSEAAEVHWHEESAPVLEAATEEDFYAALGFLHGQARGWSAVLWRQTALGRLSEWFGEETIALDEHARSMGFGHEARERFAELSESEQAALEAYTSGLNAAFSQRGVEAGQELALLHVEPIMWEPWHPLAVERLLAWLATPPLALEDAPGVVERLPDRPAIEAEELAASPVFTTPPAALERFLERDEQFRRWLYLAGFEHSLAWAARDEQGVHLYQRHTYGRSALPLFQDVVWREPGGSRRALASIPGTVMLPTGQAEDHAWAVLLSSGASLAWQPAPDSAARTESFRVLKGGERALSIQHTDTGELVLPEQEETPDSLLVLSWRGADSGGDLPAWRGLLAGQQPSFQLFDGDGLFVDTSITVLGTPALEADAEDGHLIGNGPWGEAIAEGWQYHLEQNATVTPAAWRDDGFSLWAQETATALVELLESQPFISEPAAEGLTYLENWNHAYEPNSIAATIFDRWSARFQAEFDIPPDAEVAEASWHEREEYHRFLEETVEALRTDYGDDPSRWRWQDVMEQERLYPVWGEDSPVSVDGSRNFPPQMLPGEHHPSTLAWGPSALLNGLTSPSSWEGWLLLGEENTFTSSQHALRPQGLRARLLWAPLSSEPRPLLASSRPDHTTTLTPTN